MSYEGVRKTYTEYRRESHISAEGYVGPRSPAADYPLSAAMKLKNEVIEIDPKETKLNSVVEPYDEPNSKRRRANSQIIAFYMSQFPLRYTKAESPQEKFHKLCRIWKEETMHVSRPEEKILHPAYLRIIGLGPDAIPLILAELERELGFWFWALEAISGEDPVPDDLQGDMERMRSVWIQWGYASGYLPEKALHKYSA